MHHRAFWALLLGPLLVPLLLGPLLVPLLLVAAAAAAGGGATDYETASRASLLWGPYRSNLYLGITPRIPDSFMAGLFWFNADSYTSILRAKHTCEQSDDFSQFSWTQFDPRRGGREAIRDNENKVDLVFDFVKSYSTSNAEDQSWALRVRGTPQEGFENAVTAVVFYAGLEIANPATGERLIVDSVEPKPNGYAASEVVTLRGVSKDLGAFTIKVSDGGREGTNRHPRFDTRVLPDPRYDPSLTKHVELNVPENNLWRAKDIFVSLIQESIQSLQQKAQQGRLRVDMDRLPPPVGLALPNINDYRGNLHFVQKFYRGAFEFDVVFSSDNTPKPQARAAGYEEITLDNVGVFVNATLRAFSAKFDRAFRFQKPFTAKRFREFGQDFVSNLVGGIGYFHGTHLVDRQTQIDEEGDDEAGKFKKLVGAPEGPFELFTAVPSRPFFPRGFYWDEGFHLIPVLEYDFDLALEILKSWFDLIDADGWIAREQILGAEARSKVPEDFQVQNPSIANPPTLMLVFLNVLKKAKAQQQQQQKQGLSDIGAPQVVPDFGSFGGDGAGIPASQVDTLHLQHPELLLDYAKRIYPKLQKHYEWFRRTQKGELEEFERTPYSPNEAYRWIGRTEQLCLPSGLDDYPRAETPDVGELHVDLISWVGSFTTSMKQLAELLGYDEDVQRYTRIETDIVRNIDDLHWSEADKAYCDVTLNYSDEDVFVCHKGYVSLFPFLLKLVPHDSKHIIHILNLIADPQHLFSPYGIRSLSKQDPFFRQGEDYWRGKVWVNINYLVLDSLLYYAKEKDGKSLDAATRAVAADLYAKLRVNVVNNVFRQYKKTGYAFENYDEANGNPTGVRHFLGWTSLVVMIMKMPETLP